MKTMKHMGLTNKASFYRYPIAEIDEQQVVIFEQSARIQIPTTNVIEDLASKVLERPAWGRTRHDPIFRIPPGKSPPPRGLARSHIL
ncbi:hypothetical protein M2375_000785 [Comamonas sp. BIGb0152]|uniref:hypothetical protein n=1 Tax=Comamonas sp. BIGb0152 TaxID=2940601 RepID=UPI00216A13E4|nr:hypothetical protein [Comamonas sp. BIGb0152]MCS4292579.1 hypothetical protein [Comamonas sp. BIGb0152]